MRDFSVTRQADIRRLVAQFGPGEPLDPVPFDRLPLAVPSFGSAEIEEAISSLLSGWVTMGKKVAAFEEMWAAEIGVGHAIAVNSGSSALLVMLTALVDCGYLQPGQEVLVPALGWSTSLFTVAQAGLQPILVDVDADSLCLEGKRDRPVLAIHMLGCPSKVEAPLLMEDACGAHGAKLGGQKVGSIGICGAFSFFFSHHLSTGEGGMITTDRLDLANACRSIRAHGWIRERADRQRWIDDHPRIDSRFLFATPGYNLRMTDIAGAFGMHQVPRLEEFVLRRNRNHQNWCKRIAELGLPLRVFPQVSNTRHAAFAFPLLLDGDCPLSRTQICNFLESKGIQTRPISGSNLAKQPAFHKLELAKVEGETPVADAIHERGFFVGQSHAFGPEHGALLAEVLLQAFQS